MRYSENMPIRTKEYSLFTPGKLVASRADIYSSTPIDGDEASNRIDGGTVGLIISGPQPGFEDHFQVQFLHNILWWVRHNEIEPI